MIPSLSADVVCKDSVETEHLAKRLSLDGLPLTAHQAALLREMWPHLDADWAASPYFGTVHGHTRAYIERLARQAAREAA